MKKLSTKLENKYVGAIIKRQNGITLISLVVTIVVLIILAGVAINMTLGENGIFNKAKEAKKAQIIATVKEEIGTEILAAQMDAIERNEELEQSQIEDIISKYGELQEDKDTIILKDNGYEISLLDIYQGTTTTSGSYTENKAKIELLEGQVKRLQEQLDSMSQTGDEKDKTIADLNEKITTIENEKNELQNKNNSLISKETELINLKEILAKTNTTEDKIVKDYKAYSNGKLVTGTMANYTGKTQDATVTSDEDYMYVSIPNDGYYTTESKLRTSNGNLKNEKKISLENFTTDGWNGSSGSASYNSNILKVNAQGTSTTARRQNIMLSAPINLTNVEYLIVETERTRNYSWVSFAISEFQLDLSRIEPATGISTTNIDLINKSAYKDSRLNGLLTINTKNLSGNYYIYLGVTIGGSSSETGAEVVNFTNLRAVIN